MSEAPFHVIGQPCAGGLLIVADHASNRVPPGVDLGIDPALLEAHIAVDIGVAEVARRMVAAAPECAAFLGNVSRLVCDFNRDEHGPTVCPATSDGHAIPGNALDSAGHEARLAAFYRPYHAALGAVLADHPPALILSLHSFTPSLATDPAQARPWHCGVLYNNDDRAARLALPLLAAEGLNVGDQQPYSGRLLNATMNRHAEAHGRFYLGVEVRQDEILDVTGQVRWTDILSRVANRVVLNLR